ncbi:MAG: glycine cleavage system protein GcvH [Gammaproteobacteria bacterium]
MSNVPIDLRYSAAHTWVELQDDGSVKVGITDFAQSELGDIVYVEMPELQRSYASGEECAVIESVKSASDIYCPITGEIIYINNGLEDSPEKINVDPYEEGWIFKLRLDDETELDELIDSNAYSDLIEE